MYRLTLLCSFLIACDPVATVPVPTQPLESEGLGPQPAAEVPPEDTGTKPIIDGNRAPVITAISMEPATPTTSDDITVTVEAEDPDRDHVRFEYLWTVDEVEIRGQRQRTLPHTYFEKGDMVQLKVIATDRDLETEGYSPIIFVRNTPPRIVTSPGALRSVDGFRVEAEDIDHDKLSWRLDGEPEGMSIDASSGTLSYKGSETAKAGDYQVQVIVEDPDGGSAKWAFGISVAAGKEGGPAAEPTEAEQRAEKHRERGYKPKDEAEAEDEYNGL